VATVTQLRCRACGATYDAGPEYVCSECFGPLESVYDYEAAAGAISRASVAAGPTSIWRYGPLLPADCVADADLGPGYTPLIHARRIGARLGLRNLYVKNDTVNPTWSFKDRLVALAVAAARRFGFEVLACASTGNLAGAVAAHAARAGMRAVLFIPKGLELSKVMTAAVYNPTIVEVEGTYDDVNRLCTEIASEHPWAFANINMRPFYSEGCKTLAFEACEQLGWRFPDHLVVPVASGNLLVKSEKAFDEFRKVGLVQGRTPRIHGAQAEGCSPVAAAFRAGADVVKPVRPNTVAKSLAIGNPADGSFAVKTARRTGGVIESVTDAELVEGIRLLAETEGIFAETAGGTTIATLKKLAAAGTFGADETVVAFVTGAGLKTLDAVAASLAEPVWIQPSLRDFERGVLSADRRTPVGWVT